MAPSSTTGFLPDSGSHQQDNALPYTSNPWNLFASDLFLFLQLVRYIPTVILPIWTTDPLAELYLRDLANVYDILFHAVLLVLQGAFLLSLPFFFFVPAGMLPAGSFVLYVLAVLVVNGFICKGLNGNTLLLKSNPKYMVGKEQHPDERWIFLNGVSVGHHWLQTNIDKLSLTFGRPIVGVHNPTTGILFDLIQCIIQRDFGYVTQDIRDAYISVKDALYSTNSTGNPSYKKVIFIIHSQGAIEGGLIIDWLLADMPQEMLRKLEVYSFGNAANHFNNPSRTVPPPANRRGSLDPRRTKTWNGNPDKLDGLESEDDDDTSSDNGKAIAHIEHYANSGDFVAQWGVLHFTSPSSPPAQNKSNTFVGKVFERPGNGHLLNQHYLGPMFTLDPRTGRVADSNPFMDMTVQYTQRGHSIDSSTGSSAAKKAKATANTNGGANNSRSKKRGSVSFDAASAKQMLEGTQHMQEPLSNRHRGGTGSQEGAGDGDGEGVRVFEDAADTAVDDVAFAENGDGFGTVAGVMRVKDVSRLWRYRNGMNPED